MNLNIVNIKTSKVVYSTQGAGKYNLSNRKVTGFGGTASLVSAYLLIFAGEGKQLDGF